MSFHLLRASRSRGHRVSALMGLMASCAMLSADTARADESPDAAVAGGPDRGRLEFVLGLGIAGIGQRASATVAAETTIFRDPGRGAPIEPQFDPFGNSAKRDLVKGAIALSSRLTGPKVEAIPSGPRLFVDAGLNLPLDGRATIASAEGLGPPSVREPFLYADARFHLRWFVGVGLEFVVPQSGWQLAVRPSVDYVGQSLTVRGVFDEEVRPVGLPNQTIERTASDGLSHHGVGGRLALEAEMSEFGNWIPTLFVEVQAAYLFGDFDGRLDVVGTNWLTSYEYKFERIAGSASAGFRLKWRGL